MKPLMIMITTAEIASDTAGTWKKILASEAISATIRPVIRKPPIKLKFLRVVRA